MKTSVGEGGANCPQHGHVLLHRRHADWVLAGQGRDREPALMGAAEDVAAGRIGQRPEQQVGGLFRRRG
jgi:hypothetical protein